MSTRAANATHAPPSVRLARRLERKPNGCLEWTGTTNKQGYGLIRVDGKNVLTHRLAWTLDNGPIPDGLKILHHCDNPPCCDTDVCLFLGTTADNNRDARDKRRHHQLAKTHCPAGHPYDDANTYVGIRGGRWCRTCQRAKGAARRAAARRTS